MRQKVGTICCRVREVEFLVKISRKVERRMKALIAVQVVGERWWT